jgi:hypothetical protein
MKKFGFVRTAKSFAKAAPNSNFICRAGVVAAGKKITGGVKRLR